MFSGIAAQIINDNIKTVWIVDKQYVRMAGATMQTKHVMTVYSDSKYKHKIGSKTLITNDNGGPKMLQKK